ncbi:O-methylsterigmatocystin oxidoreductase [Coprinopsis sp. MPI-PUGE-AT-0042]|nr:O-methylsterigmatocystin oxidoreductase [Coprinopsis sp. MPI-PUGE-AT-0042]
MYTIVDTLLDHPRVLALAAGSGAQMLWSKMEQRRRNPRGLPLPPGPKGVPILGNMLQIAQGKSWETYQDLSREFGNLIYLEIMGKPLLILNSTKEINDLLEKKGLKLFRSLQMGWDFGLADYGPYWKDNRRVFHQYFNPGQLSKYHPVLEQQSRVFLQRLAADPHDFMEIAKYFFGAVVMQISYGVSDPGYTSKLIDDAEAIVGGFAEVAIPGRFLVDTFHFLRFVPSWFPGAQWKRVLEGYGAKCKDVYHRTFEDAMERSRNGIQGQHANVADDIIPKLPDTSDPTYKAKEEEARNATLIAYISGVDTTTHSAHALFLALAMYPKVQKRAQEELESVIGACRLPKPSDMPKIPYLVALIKELSRWHSVAPLAVPRTVRDDAEYNGYFIPKGTMDPMEFRPERYLKDGQIDSSVLDPDAAAFGFGRRICPGRHLSNESLTFMVASLLSVFNITPAKDVNGKPVPLRHDTGTELVPKLAPFEIEIVPRSPAHAALLSDY